MVLTFFITFWHGLCHIHAFLAWILYFPCFIVMEHAFHVFSAWFWCFSCYFVMKHAFHALLAWKLPLPCCFGIQIENQPQHKGDWGFAIHDSHERVVLNTSHVFTRIKGVSTFCLCGEFAGIYQPPSFLPALQHPVIFPVRPPHLH